LCGRQRRCKRSALSQLRRLDQPLAASAALTLANGLAAGVTVDHFGYSAAFLAAGAAAVVAMGVFALRMPETAELEH
jgi:hypothetical protein